MKRIWGILGLLALFTISTAPVLAGVEVGPTLEEIAILPAKGVDPDQSLKPGLLSGIFSEYRTIHYHGATINRLENNGLIAYFSDSIEANPRLFKAAVSFLKDLRALDKNPRGAVVSDFTSTDLYSIAL